MLYADDLYEARCGPMTRRAATHPLVERSRVRRVMSRLLRTRGHSSAVEIAETKLGDHPTTADALNDLGRLLEMRGDLEQAESLHRRAIALSERLVGPMHVSVAVGLTGLGITQVTKGEYRTALGPFERAVQIFEQIPGIQINEPVARFGVAMALDGSGGDRERSIATAMKSLEQQRTLANDPRLLARIEAWLSERGRLPIAP